jgi:hypothetical protein
MAARIYRAPLSRCGGAGQSVLWMLGGRRRRILARSRDRRTALQHLLGLEFLPGERAASIAPCGLRPARPFTAGQRSNLCAEISYLTHLPVKYAPGLNCALRWRRKHGGCRPETGLRPPQPALSSASDCVSAALVAATRRFASNF